MLRPRPAWRSVVCSGYSGSVREMHRIVCRRSSSSSSSSSSASSGAGSSDQPDRLLITTPIFYVNAEPHIGHLYSALLADSLSRWHGICGRRTLFSTGTDEHGVKVQDAADARGVSRAAFCDEVSASFREAFDAANVGYDTFIRTTEPRHAATVAALWARLQASGHIYLGEHRGWYCKSDEAFLTQMQVEEVVTDGATGATAMVSVESGRPVEEMAEPNYKFRLSALQPALLAWLDGDPTCVTPPARYNEVRATVAAGLDDLSISRLREKIEWAIEVPGDADHSVYVWMDALSNYLTVGGGLPPPAAEAAVTAAAPAEEEAGAALAAAAAAPAAAAAAAAHCWPAHAHIVGKDILRFHAVYWPAFLLAAGLPPPRRVVAHAHFTIGRAKMSKSVGNVVSPKRLLGDFGVDGTRYCLLRLGGLTNDAPFSLEGAEALLNAELSDTLGNLLSRAMAPPFFAALASGGGGGGGGNGGGGGGGGGSNGGGGEPPVGVLRELPRLAAAGDDEAPLLRMLEALPGLVGAAYEDCRMGAAIGHVVDVLHECNRYFARNEPWLLRRNTDSAEDMARLATVLHVTLETVRLSALLLQPVMPERCATMLNHLGVPAEERGSDAFAFGREPGALLSDAKKIAVFPKFALSE